MGQRRCLSLVAQTAPATAKQVELACCARLLVLHKTCSPRGQMRRRGFITLIGRVDLRRNGADIVAAKFSRGTRKEMKVPKNPTAS